jgi:Mitochondrial biogenesis AIM24
LFKVVHKQLKDGETLRVTSGSIVCFESTVVYDVQMVPGIKNAMFGGEGLFITTLQGPGQVWLQGMPPDRMIAEIARRVPSGGFGIPIPIPLGGGGAGSGGDTPGGAVTGSDGAAAASVVGGEAATVAASDAAIEADRAATVATSGMGSSSNIDADSPTALFGDTVTEPSNVAKNDPFSTNDTGIDSNAQTWETGSDQQPTLDDSSSTNSFSTESTEPSFDDDFSFGDSSDSTGDTINDGELFDDTTTSSNAAENVATEGQSIFRQIWDFFSDSD